MEFLLIGAAVALLLSRTQNGAAQASGGATEPIRTLPQPEPTAPLVPRFSLPVEPRAALTPGVMFGEGPRRDPAPEPVTDGAAAGDRAGFFIGGRETVQRIGRGLQIGGQLTRHPFLVIGGAVVNFVAQFIPARPTAPTTPVTLFGAGSVAPVTGPLEVPSSLRYAPSPDAGGGSGISTIYEPSAEQIGYDPKGLVAEQQGNQARGTVQTVQGAREFTYDVPFPEVGF